MAEHKHWLGPMLAPRSIALVGGSPREGTVGNLMIRALQKGGYTGEVTVVNPKYKAVGDIQSFESMRDLPAAPDLAVLSVASQRMEDMLHQAISVGARSAVIFDFCMIENDNKPALVDRLRSVAKEANLPICGGNGMGFYNFDTSTFVSFQEPSSIKTGHIAGICHSGSVFAMLADSAGRYGFNLLTAQGQEINGTVADYMDYALDQPTTRVLALFIESIRDPAQFIRVLEKARRNKIPVVATKVGRTAASARLAITHTGAIVGNNTAFEALCQKYGVLRTNDLDSLLAAAQILSLDKKIGEGGLAALLDSGGVRELMVDVAEDHGINFPPLQDKTANLLRKKLYFGLDAVNPLDAAGLYDDTVGEVMGSCLEILEADPNIAILAHEFFSTDTTPGVSDIKIAAKRMAKQSKKPYILTYSLGTANNAGFAAEMREAGIPVINGITPLIAGIRCALEFRNHLGLKSETPIPADKKIVEAWRQRLREQETPGETETLHLISQFGIRTTQSRVCITLNETAFWADKIGYPVVLKTAAPGILHKSDVGGVYLNIASQAELLIAHEKLQKLGPEVCVAEMVQSGIELAFGMVNDPQFGPLVMVSAGGTLIELLSDRAYALAPFSESEALKLLQQLKIWRVLQGTRGRPAADTRTLARSLSQFSVACAALRDQLEEMDVNPVIVSQDSVIAVDAVLVPKGKAAT